MSDEKGHSSSPVVRPQAAKKKKKTIAQALKIVSPVPNLSSSSTYSEYNRSDGLAQASEDNSSSPWLDTINQGTGPSQPRSEFIGLRVVNEPEEEEDMNDLRTKFLERHRKRLHEAIDIVPPQAKRACPSTVPHSDEAGPSAAVVTQPDVAGPSAAIAIQLGAAKPSNALAAEEEARGAESGPDAAIAEGGPG